jgi:KDO2-lipid IV(A) lauroyltransferase
MSRVLYYVVLKPLSFLPLSILYYLSDVIFFLLYHVAGYRKAVVTKNLRNSFPDKSTAEIDVIRKAFFRHLCDVIIESIKLFSISEQELSMRFRVVNPKVLNDYYHQKRSIILVTGHYNNWEFAGISLNLLFLHQAIGIYSPLSDRFFNRKMAESRTKFGVQIITKAEVRDSFNTNRNKLTITVFGIDQSPTYSKRVHWTKFLHQDTAVHVGTELFAKKYDYPLVYIRIDKVKRGHYEARLELLHDNPKSTGSGEISDLHTRHLEKIIIERPEYWLWSHKRWKRQKTEAEHAADLTAA